MDSSGNIRSLSPEQEELEICGDTILNDDLGYGEVSPRFQVGSTQGAFQLKCLSGNSDIPTSKYNWNPLYIFQKKLLLKIAAGSWIGLSIREQRQRGGRTEGKAGKMKSSIFDNSPSGLTDSSAPFHPPSHSCQHSHKP
ncbi:hypothetical protein NQZ68_029304, partial [Dissostichus eleginoides]